MARNIHDTPFDAETLTKLKLFETYTKEWLPTMIMGKPGATICIFDFLAGPGYDISGVPGSPIRILGQIVGQYGNILAKKTKICVWFNEFDKYKYNQLTKAVSDLVLESPELQKLIKYNQLSYKTSNKDFAILFDEVKDIIRDYPTLVIIDQNGIKFAADKYFIPLCSSECTDFLYYLSSSYFVRFGQQNAFQLNLKIDMDRALSQPYKYIHESILQQLKERIPVNSNIKLYPFTIRRDANIYGIIFGASHIRAVDKFLRTAWMLNGLNGCANFDIDNDISNGCPNLFGEEMHIPTKIERFKYKLRHNILNQVIITNEDAFLFTMEECHIPSHAYEEIKLMKREGLIDYDARSPMVNYDAIYKNKNIINFRLK